MAKITITLEDVGDGSVNVSLDNANLPMKDGAVDLTKTTAAQDTLIVMMNAATDEEQGAEVERVELDTDIGKVSMEREV